MATHQKLPSSGPAREALREKGQFWTPPWVADAMVAYVTGANTDHIFDPAVGAGAFLAAAKRASAKLGRSFRLLGTELDNSVFHDGESLGLVPSDFSFVEIRDFVLDTPPRHFSAIVANPPYIRHHRLDASTKGALQLLARNSLGVSLDGRTGYHVFFLIRALDRLSDGGRLAFIMPADTCEGVFAPTLWKWILKNYRLDAVITFSYEASPFPNVDTNAMIFMISANTPRHSFPWCRCDEAGTTALQQWVEMGFPASENGPIYAIARDRAEALRTGLSRRPREDHNGAVLGDFVSTMRGIATGDNGFFFMTRREAEQRALPLEFMVRAIGRTRDVAENEVTAHDLDTLDQENRPTYLLSLNGRPMTEFPEEVQRYLRQGEELRINQRPLIRQRRPWYKMEIRKTPSFLFAYLGRRNARFVRNRSSAVPLTGFLCVYPKEEGSDFNEKLWTLLNHPETLANLHFVAKSYGGGAIKVEPRALERVPISEAALADSGLRQSAPKLQAQLAFS